MKRALLKGLAGIAVVLVTAGGVFVGGSLPVLVHGDFAGQRLWFEWLCFLPLLWVWAALIGGVGARYLCRRGAPLNGAVLASLTATLAVFAPSLLMLLYGDAAWRASYGLFGRVAVLASLAFFPSQIAFWGFLLVARIGR